LKIATKFELLRKKPILDKVEAVKNQEPHKTESVFVKPKNFNTLIIKAQNSARTINESTFLELADEYPETISSLYSDNLKQISSRPSMIQTKDQILP